MGPSESENQEESVHLSLGLHLKCVCGLLRTRVCVCVYMHVSHEEGKPGNPGLFRLPFNTVVFSETGSGDLGRSMGVGGWGGGRVGGLWKSTWKHYVFGSHSFL